MYKAYVWYQILEKLVLGRTHSDWTSGENLGISGSQKVVASEKAQVRQTYKLYSYLHCNSGFCDGPLALIALIIQV